MIARKLVQGLAFAGALCAAGSAQSILINDVNDDFVVNFSQTQGTNQLLAQVVFNVTSVNLVTGQIQAAVSISNNSILTTFINAGINSFGFQTTPQVTGSYVAPGSVFEGISNDSIPSQNNINLCVFAANNCAGGGQTGLLEVGASDVFTLLLTGTFPNGLDIVASAIKFQTSGGSFEFPGTIIPCVPGACPPPPGGDVPEPVTLLLLGAGLVATGWLRRRRV